MNKLSSWGSWLHNYDFAYNGRIWFTWDATKLAVTVLAVGDQCLHMKMVDLALNATFYCTVIYAYNTSNVSHYGRQLRVLAKV